MYVGERGLILTGTRNLNVEDEFLECAVVISAKRHVERFVKNADTNFKILVS